MDIKKWPIPTGHKELSNRQLSEILFSKADEAGYNNMGVPDLILAEAAHRLKEATNDK